MNTMQDFKTGINHKLRKYITVKFFSFFVLVLVLRGILVLVQRKMKISARIKLDFQVLKLSVEFLKTKTFRS